MSLSSISCAFTVCCHSIITTLTCILRKLFDVHNSLPVDKSTAATLQLDNRCSHHLLELYENKCTHLQLRWLSSSHGGFSKQFCKHSRSEPPEEKPTQRHPGSKLFRVPLPVSKIGTKRNTLCSTIFAVPRACGLTNYI